MSDIEDRHKHILINLSFVCTIIPLISSIILNSCAEKSNWGGSCTRHKQLTLKAAPRETVNNDSLGRSQWSGTKSLSSSWNVWSLCARIDLCTQWVTDQSSYQIELITKLKWVLLIHLNSSQSKEFHFSVTVLDSFFFFFLLLSPIFWKRISINLFKKQTWTFLSRINVHLDISLCAQTKKSVNCFSVLGSNVDWTVATASRFNSI